MRLFHTIALAVILAPTIVAAQATSSVGVQAFLRGDYEAAARILKPLASAVYRDLGLAAPARYRDAAPAIARRQLLSGPTRQEASP